MRSRLYPDVLQYKRRRELGLSSFPTPREWGHTPQASRSAQSSTHGVFKSNAKTASSSSSTTDRGGGASVLSRSGSSSILRSDMERTIHGTLRRQRVPAKPWVRPNEHSDQGKLYSRLQKVSVPEEHIYADWKNKLQKKRGMDTRHPFYKTKTSVEGPQFMQIPDLVNVDKFLGRKKADLDAAKRRAGYAKGDTVASFEAPEWFHTHTAGKQLEPARFRTIAHKKHTLLVDKTPRNAPPAGLSLQENRTARAAAARAGPHNRKRTDNVQFVRACIKQGLKPFDH